LRVILFSGKAESGKTSSALITKDILETQGYKVIKMAYGDEVKSTAKNIWGYNGTKDIKNRELLQWWGTDIVKKRYPTFWIDIVINLSKCLENHFDYFLIDDVRFLDEIESWHEKSLYDIYTVRVERPNHQNKLTLDQKLHISETSLDNYNFNNYISADSLTELEKEINEKLIPKIIGCQNKTSMYCIRSKCDDLCVDDGTMYCLRRSVGSE